MSTMYPSKKAGFTETVLWTNPNPTSSFSATNVTLSESVRNFRYIMIEAKYNTASSLTLKQILSLEDYLASEGSSVFKISFTQWNGSTMYTRRWQYMSDTVCGITASNKTSGTGSSNTTNVPVCIKGLN